MIEIIKQAQKKLLKKLVSILSTKRKLENKDQRNDLVLQLMNGFYSIG